MSWLAEKKAEIKDFSSEFSYHEDKFVMNLKNTLKSAWQRPTNITDINNKYAIDPIRTLSRNCILNYFGT